MPAWLRHAYRRVYSTFGAIDFDLVKSDAVLAEHGFDLCCSGIPWNSAVTTGYQTLK
jgi:hypothetical protein